MSADYSRMLILATAWWRRLPDGPVTLSRPVHAQRVKHTLPFCPLSCRSALTGTEAPSTLPAKGLAYANPLPLLLFGVNACR